MADLSLFPPRLRTLDLSPGDNVRIVAYTKYGDLWSTTATAGEDLGKWINKVKADENLEYSHVRRL